MGERVIKIVSVNPVEIYGVNDSTLEILKKNFPKLKIVARGDTIKLAGDDDDISHFEMKFNFLLEYFEKYGKLTEGDVEHILGGGDRVKEEMDKAQDDVLVFGNFGHI